MYYHYTVKFFISIEETISVLTSHYGIHIEKSKEEATMDQVLFKSKTKKHNEPIRGLLFILESNNFLPY